MNKYKNLAVINGSLLAIMIFFNGIIAAKIGLYTSTLIYHSFGFILILLISIVRNNKLPKLNAISSALFIPGILSVLVIFLNNLSTSRVGITLTAGMGLFGQLVISAIVDHFGLFGMPVSKLRKENILSFSLIITGLIFIITL